MNDLDPVVVYVAGVAPRRPGPGGYAAVLVVGGVRHEVSGGCRRTTAHRMRLMAPIAGLSALEWSSRVVVHSDSRVLVRSLSDGLAHRWRANGWRRTRREYVSDGDLWRQLLDLSEKHEVAFRAVQDRADHPDFERCRRLSVLASRALGLPVDEGYERQLARARAQGWLFE